MTSSIGSFSPLGQPSSSPGDCQVHNALRRRHVPGVLRVTDTADDWSSRQTAGVWGWECWRVWGCEGGSLLFVTFSLTALLLQSSWQGILPRWLMVASVFSAQWDHLLSSPVQFKYDALLSGTQLIESKSVFHSTPHPLLSNLNYVLSVPRSLSVYLQLPSPPSLHRNLIEHMNAEIVLHTITDVSIALEWLRSTFLYIRVTQNPKHYGTHHIHL